MLAPERRLRRAADFRAVVRGGRRASRPLLTVHLLVMPPDSADPAPPAGSPPSRVGLVVGKSVGGSVVRSRISRRLRHLLRDRLDALPPGAQLVVRAAPAAATATSAALGLDLDGALGTALRPRPQAQRDRRASARHGAG